MRSYHGRSTEESDRAHQEFIYGTLHGLYGQSAPPQEVELDPEEEEELQYYEIKVMQEFIIMVKKGTKLDPTKFTDIQEVEIPGLGKYHIAINCNFKKVLPLLDKLREYRLHVKGYPYTPQPSNSGSSPYRPPKNSGKSPIEKDIDGATSSASGENTAAGGLPPSDFLPLIEEYELIKYIVHSIIRIPISSLKSCKNRKKTVRKLVDSIMSKLPTPPKGALIASVRTEIIAAKDKSELHMRCPAEGCTNRTLYRWYHKGGDQFNTYANNPNWVLNYAGRSKANCVGCKSFHSLYGAVFACDQHKDDYRKMREGITFDDSY